MPYYTYTDRMAGPVTHTVTGMKILTPNYGRPFPVHAGEVRFECESANILEADAKLLAATGLIAGKEMSLCCDVS